MRIPDVIFRVDSRPEALRKEVDYQLGKLKHEHERMAEFMRRK